MDKRRFSASVRAVVEYALLSGDLTAGGSLRRMREGTRGHLARQGTLEGARTEAPVRAVVEGETFALELSGRIDALYERDGLPVVEEIKLSADETRQCALPVHRAQALVYAYLLGVPRAAVRVTYVRADGTEVVSFEENLTRGALCRAFFDLLLPYVEKIEREAAWRTVRDESLRALAFPYDAWRAGQREMAVQVYWAIRSRKRLYAQAPTGTGKTAATLYPALKALGEGLTEQVYYLTARTTGRAAARDTLSFLRQKGMRLHALTLAAKEKSCPFSGTEAWRCRMEECPRAQGFFDRLPQALSAMRERDDWSDEAARETADRFCLCPFEFSLCLCEEADAVVCDYNYAFDPAVRIRRIFQGSARVTLLSDEAHNLPDRAREMLSAGLDGREIREARRAAGKARGRRSALYAALTALLKCMETEREAVAPAYPPELLALVETALEAALEDVATGENAALCRQLLAASASLARYDASFRTLWEKTGRTARLLLSAMDAGGHLEACTKRLRGAVFFSATLSPLPVYRALLGGGEEDALLSLSSPFPRENLLVLRCPLSTRYQQRAQTAPAVAAALLALCQARPGNYLACFPSYAYLEMLRECLEMQKAQSTELLVQREGMDDAARAEFLSRFVPRAEGSLLSLAVLGGVFGESVDLPGEKLCGVAVVGVGLPQICPEREALREYGNQSGENGFEKAYRVPGMSRVTQAVGRLIRTPRDRGVALLVDDRFAQNAYQKTMPPWWGGGVRVQSAEEIAEKVSGFWRNAQGCGLNQSPT